MSTRAGTESRVRPTDLGSDFYVPQFEVRLKSKELNDPVLRDIVSVTYKDSLDDLDSVEMVLNNWDADKRELKYSDGQLFEPGGQVELFMGYADRAGTKPMLRAEVVAMRPTFPAGGQPTIAITALNVLHKLRGKQESHVYRNMGDSGIAKEIEKRLKARFKISVETDQTAAANEERYGYILQKGQYDIVFLLQRARVAGYDIYSKAASKKTDADTAFDTIVFAPSEGSRRLAYELDYGLGPHTGRSPGQASAPPSPSLIQFTPTLDTSAQVGSVTVRGFDPVRKEKITGSAKRQDLKSQALTPSGGRDRIGKTFEAREEIVNDRAIQSKPEANQLAARTLERISKGMLKASGLTIGLPDLRAGIAVIVTGVGTRFSGRYFVTSTTHTIGDGGYTTSFECRREEV